MAAAAAVINERIAVDLPDCGPPTTAMLPLAPDKSISSTSRRWS
jgi:hypothetical protein